MLFLAFADKFDQFNFFVSAPYEFAQAILAPRAPADTPAPEPSMTLRLDNISSPDLLNDIKSIIRQIFVSHFDGDQGCIYLFLI